MEGVFITETVAAGGVRLAVKDLFDTAGVRTTYGSVVFAEHVPGRSAGAVLRLEAADYVSVGKTNLHEFAYGVTSQNLHYGTVPNPAAPGRTAGGSSGGSAAALAAGLADAALGTDTGGSIRIPAACCAVAGFKPTYGLVPLDGVFPLAPSYDHAGPLARDVAGCARAMKALAPELEPAELESLAAVQVGIAWCEHADPLVRGRVEAAGALFPRTRRIAFPEPVGTTALLMREIADVHRELYAEHADLYGENIRPKIERCLAVSEGEAAAAAEARRDYERQALEALAGCDLLLTPTLAFVPPPANVDELGVRGAMTRFTYPFDALGWPALALPCGPAEDGLPASAQLCGRREQDTLVLAAGLALERALGAAAP